MNSNGLHISDIRYWRELKILAERASRDVLSGLLNRETATSYIEQYLKHMQPGDSCALFMIDLDNFKQVNDTLGHQAGDHVIRLAARALSGCFRATDIVGRLGGDEFFALLSGEFSEEAARAKARAVCEALQFSIGVSPVIHVTASVGVYIASGAVPDFESLYARADAALYEAKAGGRNRFHVGLGPEAALRRPEGAGIQVPVQFDAILKHMEEGVALIELGDTASVIYASPALCRMMGVDEKALSLPCGLSAFGSLHPDDMAEYERLLREGAAAGCIVEYEHRFSVREGQWRWCRSRAVRHTLSGSGLPVMLVFTTDISAVRKRDDRLLEDRERLKLLLDQGGSLLWEVDIVSRTFRLFNVKRHLRSTSVCLGDFPESLIERGWVHPDSAVRFRAFAGEILGGSHAGGGAFIMRHKMSRSYGWYSLSYAMVPDDDRRPLKVVGLARPLHGMLSGSDRLWEALRPNLFAYIRLDLSDDRVDTFWVEGSLISEQLRDTSCEALLSREKKRLFFREERGDFEGCFSRTALLESFARGRSWVVREYRRVDRGGIIRWISYTAYLSRNPQSGHVQASVFLQNTQLRHAREDAVGEEVRYLPAAGMYGRKTARKIAESVMRGSTSSLHSLSLVRMVGLAGREVDATALQCRRDFVSMAFALLLGSDCVVGEWGEDSFTVFRPDAASCSAVRQRVDDAFAFVRQALADSGFSFPLRFVAAVACLETCSAKYDAVLAEAEKVCASWLDAPSDAVVFVNTPSAAVQGRRRKRQKGYVPLPRSAAVMPFGEDAPEALPASIPGEKLSSGEKDVALACLAALLAGDSPEAAMAGALRRIGEHYQADRVYLLSQVDEGRAVNVIQEWTAEGVYSLGKHISGMPLDRLPLLRRSLKENTPFFINRGLEGTVREDMRPWSFAVFPLAAENCGPEGLLCMENPRLYRREDALIPVLLPSITGTQRRFCQAGGRGAAMQDSLTGLQNLRAYMDRAYMLTSDSYSSMGALTLDISAPSATAGNSGAGQSARMLLNIAETLGAVFGRSLLFRTRSDEFVALCPDTTQDVFLARVLRAQSMLQRRYPRQLRFGYTWAEGLFAGEKLVKEARTIMLCGRLEASAGGAALPSLGRRGPGMAGTGDLEKFTVFFQPKVDMRTGGTVGAEALVRGLDGAGLVIPPSRFMENMEKSGSIRELDLYVLNQTLAAMENWRRKGLRLLPVSVNFSRYTLFSPSSPGSVLAILSRYPSLPPELVEIEVSEAALDVETGSLKRIMGSFRPFGLRFGLDDFGCRYSNLSLFTNVNFDTVKLDRSLIRDIVGNSTGRALVGDILRLCSGRNMTCVAEGVEMKAQADALLDEGCLYAQGFYYARPLPAGEFEQNFLSGESGAERHGDPSVGAKNETALPRRDAGQEGGLS